MWKLFVATLRCTMHFFFLNIILYFYCKYCTYPLVLVFIITMWSALVRKLMLTPFDQFPNVIHPYVKIYIYFKISLEFLHAEKKRQNCSWSFGTIIHSNIFSLKSCSRFYIFAIFVFSCCYSCLQCSQFRIILRFIIFSITLAFLKAFRSFRAIGAFGVFQPFQLFELFELFQLSEPFQSFESFELFELFKLKKFLWFSSS